MFGEGFKKHLVELNLKYMNAKMIICFILFSWLIFSVIFNDTDNSEIYTRLLPMTLLIFILLLNLFTEKYKSIVNNTYLIFLTSATAMMYAEYIIHIEEDTAFSIIGIIGAIFIISLDIRTKLINVILIYFVPLLIFLTILFLFYDIDKKDFLYLSGIIPVLFLGFSLNRIQNNLILKAFKSTFLLSFEKKKVEDLYNETLEKNNELETANSFLSNTEEELKQSNEELNRYKNMLEKLVEDKTQSLNIALQKAKESDDLKTAFLYNISHEIRTPMNAVMGLTQILSESDERLTEEHKIIDKQFLKLTRTIDDILLLSKLQADQYFLKKSEFKVKSLLNDLNIFILKLLENETKDISFEIQNDFNEEIKIKADFVVLKIILTNLLDNSIKYSNSGIITLKCSVIEDKVIVFTVNDTGIGIKDSEIPLVFDVFRKLNDKEFHRGIGAGLAIVKKLVDLHKGDITINSKVGKGSEFNIVIPI